MGADIDQKVGGASRARARASVTLRALIALVAVAVALPAGTVAELASAPALPAAGQTAASEMDAGRNHTCAILPGAGVGGNVRCWGFGREGELGYGNRNTIGDNETPSAAGPVKLGEGRTAVAISAGDFHTCALLDNSTVRCWGFGGNGRLGYGSQSNIGDDETPDSVGPVELGLKAKAITAGGAHTCAILENDAVRCWGYAAYGQLGYGNPPIGPGETTEPNPLNIGDDESPDSVGPVELGDGRTAKAISAGDLHTCAILDNNALRCWGSAAAGRLGSGNRTNVGDRDTPSMAPVVNLGEGRTAKAISGGASQTCAVLDDDTVRCWGYGGDGRLGYGNEDTIGDDELPSAAGPVSLGAKAKGISVGDGHACAVLVGTDAVRCWGYGGDGRLGYGNKMDIGDDELPSSIGPVDLGSGRSAAAISLGGRHSCARLDDANVRCWGLGANGRLGYCNETNVGDNETPGSTGPVNLGVPGSGTPACAAAPRPAPAPPPPKPTVPTPSTPDDGLAAEATRASALRSCLRRASHHAKREISSARRLSGEWRARAKRHVKRHRNQLRHTCLKRHGRTPDRVTGLDARAVSKRKVRLTFNAPGTDGAKPPAARAYLVKQSRRRIRGARGFRRAQTLCKGSCRFAGVRRVGAKITLTITDLRPGATYYYAVAARDNVSRRLGRRSRPVKARTRR